MSSANNDSGNNGGVGDQFDIYNNLGDGQWQYDSGSVSQADNGTTQTAAVGDATASGWDMPTSKDQNNQSGNGSSADGWGSMTTGQEGDSGNNQAVGGGSGDYSNMDIKSPSTGGGGSNKAAKMFVGGISWRSTEESMKEYFEQYGPVKECVIKVDEGGNPRGFGFVEFVDVESVDRCLNQPEHYLDKKKIDPKRAVPRDNAGGGNSQMSQNRNNPMMNMMAMMNPQGMMGMNQQQAQNTPGEKNPDRVFVGGLPATVTAEDLTREFTRFGTVLDTKLMMDKDTGRSKGYAFIQFESEELAQNVVQQCNAGEGLVIHDKKVDVKSAVRRARPQQSQQQMPGMGGFGGNMDMQQQMAMMSQYMMMQNPQFMAMANAMQQQGGSGAAGGYQMPMVDPNTGYPIDPSSYMGSGAQGYGAQWDNSGYDQQQQQQQQQYGDQYGEGAQGDGQQSGKDGQGDYYSGNNAGSGGGGDGWDDGNNDDQSGRSHSHSSSSRYNNNNRSYSGRSSNRGGRDGDNRYDRSRDDGSRYGNGNGRSRGGGRDNSRRYRGGSYGGSHNSRSGNGGSSGYHPYSR